MPLASRLNPFFFRASAEPRRASHQPVRHVSIPFSSGPVLNTGKGRKATALCRLNPFFFRASAERAVRGSCDMICRLNPFFFRASAERCRRCLSDGWYFGLNPFFFRASAEQHNDGNPDDRVKVSIPFSSGPVLNGHGAAAVFARLNPFFFRASAEPPTVQAACCRLPCVSIPFSSGPVLNMPISRRSLPTAMKSQSLFLQGQC